MNKNVKKIFFMLTLMTILLAISTVSAMDDSDNSNIVSDQTIESDVSSDYIQTATSDNTLIKTNKEIKKDSITSNDIENTNVIENQEIRTDTSIKENTHIKKGESSTGNSNEPITIDGIEYTNIIQNEEITSNTILRENTYINNCNIVMGMWDYLVNNATTYINNTSINASINNSNLSQLYFENSNISGKLVNNASATFTNSLLNMSVNNKYGIMTINDDCILGEGLNLDGVIGEIIINDRSRLLPHQSRYEGNITLENVTLCGGHKTNDGNLTLINCTFAYTQQRGIYNYGNLTLIDTTVLNLVNNQNAYANNTTFSGSFQNSGNLTLSDDVSFNTSSFYNYGTIFINNSNIIYPYLRSFRGNHHLSNIVIDKSITNEAQSTLTLSNVTLNQTITNQGTLVIDDNCIFATGFRLNNYGNITINDTNRIYPYTNSFNGENTLSNLTIDKAISNAGTLTLKNVTIASTINNNGILIIDDNCTFTENVEIYDYGEIIINDTTRITPYLPIYNGEYTVNNSEFTTTKTNNGNLTIINSILTGEFYNYGTATFKNSVLNGYLQNEGTLIIDDNTVFGDDLYIEGAGEIITNQSDALLPYLTIYNGDYTIIDTLLDSEKANYGNLTIINSTLENYLENYGNLTVINTVLNGQISNDGILNISDDCTLGENLIISGNGQIICSNINNLVPYMSTLNGNYTLENITLTGTKTNNGNLTLKNTTLDCTLTNNGVLNISDDCEFGENFKILGNGQIICDDFGKIMPYLSTINGNYTLENWNITKDLNLYGNIELVNCNIKAKITNYENLSIINSSLSNNRKDVSSSKADGFLINNIGNLNMINCVMENNTFDTTITYYYSSLQFYGAIVNNGNMTITDSRFKNNKLGHYFAESYNNYYGNSFGNGSVVYNKGLLTISNSNFTNNYAGSYGGAINSIKNLTINNCNFNDNTAIVGGGAIGLDKGQAVITNSIFKGNNATLRLTVNELCGGGAIYASNSEMIINNCTFDNNQAISYITGIAGVNSKGGSIAMINMKANISDSTFKNHKTEVIQGGKIYYTYNMNATISNCLFENNNGGIIDYTKLNIINNTFKNTTGDEVINNMITNNANKTISQNKFIDNHVTTETINKYVYFDNTILNITAEENTYQNTTINDTLQLDVPEDIHEGVDITITGLYTINNPDNYDSNIMEQNKFNVYLNGVLSQTVDELSFTIKPTSGTTILTVQPTISQTRKSVTISPTTISDITITPDNYDDYIYEEKLIGVSKGSIVTFTGEFNDKGEICVDTEGVILNGEDATFTNTVFVLDTNYTTLRNMNINNINTDYPISNFGKGNTITNNTITITKDEGQIAAIKNIASDATISNNILIVSGPANTIDFSETSEADTQAILLLGGDNNKVINNTISVSCSGINTMYGTIEGITNSEGATNTLITQNRINVTGANFNYGINCLVNDENLTITENTMIITGERYCDGVQVGNGVKNILITDNNITCVCINTTVLETEGAITYGVIASNMGSSESENITVNNNNIDITGTANYAIEFYKVKDTQVNDNNITVNGPFSMGIAYSYSPNGVATGNTISTSGDGNTPINYITEEVKQENTGIRIQNGTQNILIENNTITTSDEALNDTTIHSDAANITIRNNILSSSTKTGDASLMVPFNAIVENNKAPDNQTNPGEDDHEWTSIIITPSNFNNYFDWSGFKFEEYTIVYFNGTFTNVETAGYSIPTANIIIDGTNASFIDTTFSLQNNNITLQNINFTSSNKYSRLITADKQKNLTIINSTITLNNTKTVDDIYAQWGLYSPLYTQCIRITNTDGVYIENNTINVYGPSIAEVNLAKYYIANTYAIEVYNSSNANINNNIITVQNSTEPTEDSIINAVVLVNTTKVKVTDNTLNISGAVTLTAINNTNPQASDIIEDNTIITPAPEEDDSQWNKIIVTPENINQYVNFEYETNGFFTFEPFTKAIFVGTFSNMGLNFKNDNIIIDGSNATFTDVQFGISRRNNITIQNTKMNSSPDKIESLITASERSNNVTVKNNTLTLYNTKSLDTTYAQWGFVSVFYTHGIFFHSINNSCIEDNTINIYGPSVDQNSGQPNTYAIETRVCNNVSIKNNNIHIENTTTPTEESLMNGIWISFNSSNIKITDNIINVSGAVTTTAINNTSPDESNIIEDNEISENPIISPTISLDDIIGVINMPTTITATVTDNDGNAVTDGTVTFMDEDENILGESSLTDGTASITVTFTEELTTEVIAVYTPVSGQYLESSASSMLTIEPPLTVITISTDNLKAGETAIITATVTDQAGNAISSGKVAFKINGKTIKDANGKVIYAKIINGVATVEYDVPLNMSSKIINITATYSGSGQYKKATEILTTTVTAPEPTITIIPFDEEVQSGSTVTFKAKVMTGDIPITTGKIIFKINGKSIKDENGKVIYGKVDANGEVSVDYNIGDLRAKTYTVEAVFISSEYDRLETSTTMTVVNP